MPPPARPKRASFCLECLHFDCEHLEKVLRRRYLTEREVAVLRTLMAGEEIKIAAHRMGLTPSTVKVYRHRLYKLLGVVNQTQAAVWAMQHLPDNMKEEPNHE
jgi:DNA-binding NarL/FixJ family response regulator